ncbi:MAG: dihydrolipoyl dehydrogenase [Candidatus Dactylopiibacterium carminicum]|uniref:Dihydrolipoyl dehydrogenase n=1 Tax=Candidatus Dactylopiibacterium carminicum TaxID=857335 RepID=A0A272ES59_9RHOO|nr:dihydrolipoyl dehydrogenase [Candidatus Dactylopiibacterium carminicum]KAF7598989.1 dihydrolipoyl dehydrogenase [Candidatus Dactylopiibacterium carminicum]PAS92943.1 MAG: dihydrolipoyl dehydrogenase [Candidatus Dactylopiibacterium carminicum]PAS96594.1 MAG: dihydrolipoyl dehydrogenase [Candidatus Dactylopiibacterium carminicum]PAS99001.1 MAG: dihydrolipoyl dehydrogenase [Candidatus Dactylopiibacterium carminicum]
MSQLIEVKVPDIGDFKDVPVIELFVKPGDTVNVDDSIATLESDKATLDVPAPAAGVVKSVSVKVGDRVSEGSVLLMLDAVSGGAATAESKPAEAPAATAPAAAAPVAVAPVAGSHSGGADIECEMLVLGAGPGGYSAAFRSADLGMKTVLVERFATLGGVCLNVGCIPSKALLHVANVIDEAAHFADVGVAFDAPRIDIDRLRSHKQKVIDKLTTGLTGMAKARKVDIVRGYGNFIDPHHLEVELTAGEGQKRTGEKKVIKFQKCIIAAGSSVVKLPFIPEDPRIVDSTGALELRGVPKRMLVIGGGIIGLEMATVYSTLGARIDVVEAGDGLMPGADRDLVKVWEKRNLQRFDKIMLKTRTVGVTCRPDGVLVKFEGDQAPDVEQKYDLVLVAVGRSPNGKKIGAEKAGVLVTDRGFIQVDKQQRTNVSHIFAIGDIVGQPMLAHKGVHEAHVAAEVAAGHKAYFDASVIPGVAYTEPEVAWVGVTEAEAKAKGRKIGVGKFPWAASGRAIANGCDYGFTKLIFDEETHRIIGGGIVGPNAGDMIGEITLAIEMGCDPVDIGKTIHPHPTLGESIGMAAEVFEGTCTDLPPQKKK